MSMRLTRNAWLVSAHALVVLAVAACAFAFALYRITTNTSIPGADPHYRYWALGYARPTGVNFGTVGSWTVDDLPPLLPHGFSIGSADWTNSSFSHVRGGATQKIGIEWVQGDYLAALHLHALAGRLLTLADVYHATPVAVISEPSAQKLFGGAAAAIGRHLYGPSGYAVTVVGVLPAAFAGTNRAFAAQLWMPFDLGNAWYEGQMLHPKPGQRADLMDPGEGIAPLLSTPAHASRVEVDTVLQRLLTSPATRKLFPPDVTALVPAQPYSHFPDAERAAARRVRLFLDLALGTLALAVANVLAITWLQYLRQRPVLRLERILGAQRAHWLRRVLARGALTFLLSFVLALPVFWFAVHLLKREIKESYLAQFLQAHLLWASFASWLALLLLVLWVIESLPFVLLLWRERVDEGPRVIGSARDRRVGAGLQVLEVLLAATLTVTAAWSMQHAWRIAHAHLGFLDRPATLVMIAPRGVQIPLPLETSRHAALLMRQLVQATRGVLPGAVAGFGPQISAHDFALQYPHTLSVGTRTGDACHISMTPDWVTATGMHLLAGENLAVLPQANGVLIDTAVADRLFGSPAAAIGRTIDDSEFLPNFQAVVRGVVTPIQLAGAGQPQCPSVFRDKRVNPINFLYTPSTLAIAGVTTAAQRERLRQVLDRVLAQQGAAKFWRIERIDGSAAMRARLAARVVSQARHMMWLALFAWAIALIGILALLRLSLAQRKRLLAIRSALGERPTHVYRDVVLTTLLLAGLGMGVLLFFLPWLATQYALLAHAEVPPFGVVTWIALAVLLLAVFLVAHFPARRAARAEPATSLHEL
ncbi:ABC transporter permease [Metallibacterium sp.]|uniref:ABC transporter permease n=2 Tax=Metallibacterium sp. TaxID=2940281 RepID=UPI00263924D4|nr:ABC transporter permease [Metallibacterium sp.]